MNITEDRITSLAPNANAVANARKISKSGGFAVLKKSADNTLIFGECSGSGKSNYITSVDFIDDDNPVFRCSCPSRQFPCKHGLAIMFDYLAKEKDFKVADIPEDIVQKREKKAAAAENKEKRAKSSTPSKTSKAAAVRKMKKQLEGFELVDKFISEAMERGISSLGGSSTAVYEDLAKQLGDYYLTGAQNILNEIIFNIKKMDKETEASCEKILELIVKLNSISKKEKVFLSEKIEKGEMPAEDSPLLEFAGFTWQLAQLKEIGLCRTNAEIIQLSFDIVYNEAGKEYVDTGWWIDLSDGVISKTENHRPLKAVKYIKEDDTVFDVVTVPELCMYPGEVNRRIRWEASNTRPVTSNDISKIKGFAAADINSLLKSVKNFIKNPLSDNSVTAVVKYDSIAKENDDIFAVFENTYITLDGVTSEILPYIASSEYMTVQIYEKCGQIHMQPLSVITDEMIIRSRY